VSAAVSNPNPQARFGARRRARQCALQMLYQLDGVAPAGGTAGLGPLFSFFWQNVDSEAATTADTVKYAEALVQGVLDHLAEVDAAIQAKSRNWRLDRMARVDRNVLRLSTYELLHVDSTPGEVILNEGVDLAKQFGSGESHAFVNGILDTVAKGLGR
jgi:transcription antitermination protein NusB